MVRKNGIVYVWLIVNGKIKIISIDVGNVDGDWDLFLEFEKKYLKKYEVNGYKVIFIECKIYDDLFKKVFMFNEVSVLC